MVPYIYQHKELGATVVAFKVSNLGPGWKTLYPGDHPMLVLPFRTLSEDALQKIFSRSMFAEPRK